MSTTTRKVVREHESEAPHYVPSLSVVALRAIDVEPGELIGRWLAGLSDSARRAYRRSLARFSAWMLSEDARPERALEALCGLDVGRAGELVRTWRGELEASGLSSGSVAGYVGAVCSLVSAARRAGLVGWKLEAVLPRYEPRRDMRGPAMGDVERLLAVVDDAAADGNRKATRDAAALRLLFGAALRRAEVLGLDVEHVDVAGRTVRVRRKGSKERRAVLIGHKAAESVERWLAVRGTAPGPLFVATKGAAGGALTGTALLNACRAWAKRAGVRVPVRCHGLRHAAATAVAQRGTLASTMALGEWKSYASASRYLDAHRSEREAALRIVDV